MRPDLDAACPEMILSGDGKHSFSLPSNPKRFGKVLSVLAPNGFSSGLFDYEVLVNGKGDRAVGSVG